MKIEIIGDVTSLVIDGIPYVANVTPIAEEQYEQYIVKKGDTLWKISQQYGMTVAQLKKLNNLVSDVIHVGNKFKVIKSTTVNTIADEMMKHEGAKEYEGIVATIQKWYYGSIVKQPWCATCISYFADICGVSKQIGKHENVDRMKDYLNKQDKIKMSKAYGGDYIPKKGDIIFFSSNHTYDDCTHVGAVISVTNNNVTWIGGNTSDKIMVKTNNMKSDKYVVCYGVIDY